MKSLCPVAGCGKTLSCRYRLKTHIERFHLNIRRFECTVCLKMFKSKDNLKDHMGTHPKPTELSSSDIAWAHAHLSELRCEIEVPKLTELVSFSSDIVLRPFTCVVRVYPYPIAEPGVVLPPIEQKPAAVESEGQRQEGDKGCGEE